MTAPELGVVQPETQQIAEVDQVSDGYLETMGVRLLQGRFFREEEVDPTNEVAIVNDFGGRSTVARGNAVRRRIALLQAR